MRKYLIMPLLLLAVLGNLSAQNLSGVRIYINPGHGGYDSDDRNVVIPPYAQGDPNGFWESKSNLHKGTYLKEMLDSRGAITAISRTQNRTEDDLPLSQIVRAANEFNSDLFLSIHTNAGGISNHVLMLYAGRDLNDTKTYPSQPSPEIEQESRTISEVIAKNLYKNQLTPWAHNYSLRGDKTAAFQWFGWSDGYGVFKGVTVPTVLSEGSMHDYIPETYRLMNMEYKYLEAWNFLKSITSYFKSDVIPHGVIAGSVRDKFLHNPAPYAKIANSNDIFLPINGATVKLVEKNLVYTTDNMNNGIYVFKELEPGTYTLEVSAAGYHPLTFTMNVEANNISYSDTRLNLIRNTPPQVIEYSPKALTADTVMLSSSVIRFKFNWDVDPISAQEAFSITPAVEGQFVFKESNFVMEFVPNAPLDTSTVYTVKLAKTLRHFDGLSMENDFIFQFKTDNRNKLALIAAYPLPGETNIDYKMPTFTFVFDKKLQTAELISGVQVYDAQGQVINKNVRSLRHNNYPAPFGSTSFTLAQDLIPGQSYVVKLAKGIKDEDDMFLPETMEIPFQTSDERITNKLVVENFEVNGKLTLDAAASVNTVSATASTSSVTRLFNTNSYNLKYNFSTDVGSSVVYKFAEPTIEVTNDSVIGLHIYGDLSGNELYLMFASANDTKEILLDSIHYGGWKFAEASLKDLLPQISYKLTGFKFVQKKAPLSKSGNVFVDNMLAYSGMITSVSSPEVANIRVYPNPVRDVINIAKEAGQIIEKIELYSLKGQLMRSTMDASMQVSDIPSGTYVIRVKLNEGIVSKSVIIIR